MYVGTVGEDLLRLDVLAMGQAAGGTDVATTNNVMVANWSGAVLVAGGVEEPFYTKAVATFDPAGDLWVFIGSGPGAIPC